MKISDIKGCFKLNNGVQMPYFGLGVYLSKEGNEVENAILWALEAGYRHIDTAAFYKNEQGVGQAVKKSGLDRKEIFVTTKLWNADQGYDAALKAFDNSLDLMGFEYVDLYLIHWPVKGKYVDSWKAMEKIYAEGRAKAIGVSNFKEHHLDDVLQSSDIVPAINQVEFHPYLVQNELLEYCQSKTIQLQSWSPLMLGKVLTIDKIKEIGLKYGKTPVQVVLRWNLQKGIIAIPKSVKQERILSNADVFDFELQQEDILAIDDLNRNQRIGPDPDFVNF